MIKHEAAHGAGPYYLAYSMEKATVGANTDPGIRDCAIDDPA